MHPNTLFEYTITCHRFTNKYSVMKHSTNNKPKNFLLDKLKSTRSYLLCEKKITIVFGPLFYVLFRFRLLILTCDMR